MLRAYLPPLIIAVLICGGLTFYVKILAKKFKIFDRPSPRKIHPFPVPRLGGVAIVGTFLLLALGYTFASNRLEFTSYKLWFFDPKILGMMIGLLIVLLIGVIDDIRGVKAYKKLFWQIVASCIVVAFGASISFIRLPFGLHLDLGTWQIPFSLFGWDFVFLVFADLVSVFWLVLLMNTFNFLDGLDGLATGIGFITAMVLFFLSVTLGQDANALLAVLIAGVALGFLPWNFNPARIFLGDSGSLALGYLIGVLSLISGGKMATAFLVLGIPVLDVGWVVIRRIFKGISPFNADKLHFHHRLLTAGLSQRQAVLLLYFISIIFGLIAVFSKTQEKITALLWLIGIMVVFAITLVIVDFKKNAYDRKRRGLKNG